MRELHPKERGIRACERAQATRVGPGMAPHENHALALRALLHK
jgi:hypothetical protein